MRKFAFVLVLLMSSPLAGTAWAVECTTKIATFNLVQGNKGDIVIPIVIEGKPFNFELSFDHYDSLLEQEVADSLGLESTKINGLYTAAVDSEKVSHFVWVKSALVGETPRNFTALLIPGGNVSPGQVAGVLGLNFLAYFDVDLDFGGNKITFFTPNWCDKKDVVYWTSHFSVLSMVIRKLGNFDFPVSVGSAPMQFGIRSSDTNIIKQSFATRALPSTQVMPGFSPLNPGSGFNAEQYHPRDLKIGDVVIPNPQFAVKDDVTQPTCESFHGCYGDEAAGYISMNQLKALHMYISYMKKRIFVSAAAEK
jgi:hypothetical protein